MNHQGQFPSVTISFNLTPGVSLGRRSTAIDALQRSIGLPSSIHGSFAGTAQAFQDSLANEPMLILAALGAVYIVLGILYESYIHPITILSTLPSAGVGALLALMICRIDLTVIALIGIILLIGIVKKNAIMMIDFALEAERKHGKSALEAIYEACLLRFRPIMMTTMAALLGALPLAVGTGTGSELRRPLGIAIVGGLDREPDAHAVHDPGDLPVHGTASPVGRESAGPLLAQARREARSCRRLACTPHVEPARIVPPLLSLRLSLPLLGTWAIAAGFLVWHNRPIRLLTEEFSLWRLHPLSAGEISDSNPFQQAAR